MSASESVDSSKIQSTVASIGLSAIIVMAGSFISQSLGLGTRIALTRFLPLSEYGNIVIGITVLNLLGLLALLGLGETLTRYIPRYNSTVEKTQVVVIGYQLGLLLAVFWGSIVFLSADLISIWIFDNPDLSSILRIFSFSLPFYVIYKLSINGIRGHQFTIPYVLNDKIILPVSRIIFIILMGVIGFGTFEITIGYNLAYVIVAIVGTLWLFRIGTHSMHSLFVRNSRSRYREFLYFSIPLAASASIDIIIREADILLLGILRSSDQVGVYDVAILIAMMIMFFSPPLNYLFQPIVSEYESNNNINSIENIYKLTTRWMIVLTFPVFAFVILFPETILGTFFGQQYHTGSVALSILAIGFFATRLVGLSGSLLIAIGATKALLVISILSAVVNIVLNLGLIPFYGIEGAAVATAFSRILNNLLQSLYIYKKLNIHSFDWNWIYPTSLITIILVIFYFIVPRNTSLLTSFLLTFGLLLIYVVIMFTTRSVYLLELTLLDSLLERIGVNSNFQNYLGGFTPKDRKW